MNEHGEIFREGDTVVVRTPSDPWAFGMPGVVCINPDLPEDQRIYEKRFSKKRIYFPGEYEAAMQEISCQDMFVPSMNGFSQIDEDQCRRYGVKPLTYEAACEAILTRMIQNLHRRLRPKVRLISGASDLAGVDAAIARVARKLDIPLLGFSCPRYMLFVSDDDHPVYVASNKDAYCDAYIQSLDLLIATGGRETALRHDVAAACIYDKRIHFVDVLNSLSATGGVPATIKDKDGRTKVDNAAAAMGRNVSFFGSQQARQDAPLGGDHWDAIFYNVNSVAIEVCRAKMSHEGMFPFEAS